jgi:hypothetical protein
LEIAAADSAPARFTQTRRITVAPPQQQGAFLQRRLVSAFPDVKD